ncbi:hypothetical protein GF312_09730 [Candidatus Poribacteria bacterium]|nr:hypothetical protein [Candidatus Poribacteria bacterium]
MKILRTAVVGLGRIGWRFHVPEIVKNKGFELMAVVDPVAERLDEARLEFGVKTYEDHNNMFKAQEIDLVVIASPTKFHCEHTIAAFENDCHVFCDKPMASSLDEADAMIDSMNRYGKKMMIYQPHRARNEFIALKDIINSGIIGPVFMIRRANSGYNRRNDWQAFRQNAGGMLNNYGAHYIDQTLHLSGSKSKRIVCFLRSIASLGDADDVVKAIIETESGIIIDLEINQASAHPIRPWQILGKRGSVVFDEEQKAWKIRYYEEEELEDINIQEGLAAKNRRYGSGETIPWQEKIIPISEYHSVDFYQKCYEYFVMGHKSFVPVEETREVMRIISECRKFSNG